MQGERERQQRQWKKAGAARTAARTAKHSAFVRDVAYDLVDFALRVAEFRAQTGMLVPKKEYNGWVAELVAGKLSAERQQSEAQSAAAAPAAVIDAAALQDYLEWAGEWDVDGTEDAVAAGHNVALAQLVHGVRAQAQPRREEAPIVLDMPVRMAVVGGPFTGKTTLAQALAKEHNAHVLDPEALVQDAITAASVYDNNIGAAAGPAQQQPGGADSTGSAPGAEAADAAVDTPRKVQIGRQAQELLLDGETLDGATLVELVVLAVLELQAAYSEATDCGAKTVKQVCAH